MTLKEVLGLPICYVEYLDLCQHEYSIESLEESRCKKLEVVGRCLYNPDSQGNIKVLNILDLSDGDDSQFMVIPKSCVLKIQEMSFGATVYDNENQNKTIVERKDTKRKRTRK